jgi:hypothetical protein
MACSKHRSNSSTRTHPEDLTYMHTRKRGWMTIHNSRRAFTGRFRYHSARLPPPPPCPSQALALCLAREMAKDDASDWTPFLRVLPRVHSLAHWAQESLLELQNEYVVLTGGLLSTGHTA